MIKSILILIFASFSQLTSADNGGCFPPWIASDIYCYYIGNNQTISWSEASDECHLRLGHLLRIESAKEATFIKSYFKYYPAPAYWTALNDIDPSGSIDIGTGTWLWGNDEYPDNNIMQWNVEPDNANDEDCCALNIQATFSDEQCSTELGYICQIKLPPDGSCPMYWLQGENIVDCFYVSNSTDPKQLITWGTAKTKCNGMQSVPGASKPYLLTINSKQDATFWTKSLFRTWSVKSPMKYWTGLNDRVVEGTYVWDNAPNGQNPLQFVPVKSATPWDIRRSGPQKNCRDRRRHFTKQQIFNNWTKEPNNLAGMEHCGVILDEGKFSDRNCREQHGYICRKQQVNQQYPVNFGCDDWLRAGQKCYFTFDKPQSSWQSSRDYCRSLGADLLKLENKDEVHWLNAQTKTGTVAWGGHWIGLNDIATKDHVNGWVWADGTKADTSLLNWDSSPHNIGGTSNCAAMYQDGVFSDADCHIVKQGFICEKDYKGTCPQNWKAHGTSCYYISHQWTTWVESLDACKKLSGDNSSYPFAINTLDEKQWILNQVSGVTVPPFSWWSSLNSITEPGLWLYTRSQDNTKDALALVVWATEPNNYRGAEDCTIVFQEGRLNDEKCSNKMGFICEKLAAAMPHPSPSASHSNSSVSTVNFSAGLYFTLSLICIVKQTT